MLKVRTRTLGDVTVLCLQGQIVAGEPPILRGAVLSQTEARVVILDLGGVSTIDAGGLGVLLELREQTLSRHIEFRFINVPKLISRVLEMTRLDSVFEIWSETVVAERARASGVLQFAPCA